MQAWRRHRSEQQRKSEPQRETFACQSVACFSRTGGSQSLRSEQTHSLAAPQVETRYNIQILPELSQGADMMDRVRRPNHAVLNRAQHSESSGAGFARNP